MIYKNLFLFLIYILSVNFFGIIGYFFINKFKKYFLNTSAFVFSSLTIGITLTVILTSLSVTYFKSVNLILLLVCLFVYHRYFIKNNYVSINTVFNLIDKKKLFLLWGELNIVSVLVFGLYFFIFSYKQNEFIGLPSADTSFYARMSSNFLIYQN